MTLEKHHIIRAGEIMREGVVSIDGIATARVAIETMQKEDVSSLVVNKRTSDDAWGLVNLVDIVREVIAPGRSPDDVNVYEMMTKPVVTVPAEMDVRYVGRLLVNLNMRRIPVEKEGELVGMVSLADIVLKAGLQMVE
jgi:CBS domain-containing protein